MRPPPPCMAANTITPPNKLDNKPGFIKKLPIMRPAIDVEITDKEMSDKELERPLSRTFLYHNR